MGGGLAADVDLMMTMHDRSVVAVHIEPKKHMTPADRQKLGKRLAKEYDRGLSLVALAARHGTSAGRVRLLLLEQGVTLRPRGGDMRRTKVRRRRSGG